MKYNLKSKVIAISNIGIHYLPGGRIKEWLKRKYFKYANPLYRLNGLISKATLIDDKTLCVQFVSGIRLHGPWTTTSPWLAYGDPKKLDKIKRFYNFGTFINGLWEQYVEAAYEKNYTLKKGDVVIDIGANIGTFSIKAAKIVGDEGKIIAIEPAPGNLEFLRRNVEANGLRNVVIISKGVWSSKGKASLYLSDFPNGLCNNSF